MEKKRVTAGVLALLMVFMTVVSVLTPGMTAQAAGTTLIVHYGGRADNSYEGWKKEGKDSRLILLMRMRSAKWLCTRPTGNRQASDLSCA